MCVPRTNWPRRRRSADDPVSGLAAGEFAGQNEMSLSASVLGGRKADIRLAGCGAGYQAPRPASVGYTAEAQGAYREFSLRCPKAPRHRCRPAG